MIITHRGAGHGELESTKESKTSQLCDWFMKHAAQGPDPVLPQNPRTTKARVLLVVEEARWGGVSLVLQCASYSQGQELQEWEGCLHPGCHEGKKAVSMKYTYMSSPCLSSSLASVSPPCQHQGPCVFSGKHSRDSAHPLPICLGQRLHPAKLLYEPNGSLFPCSGYLSGKMAHRACRVSLKAWPGSLSSQSDLRQSVQKGLFLLHWTFGQVSKELPSLS